MRKTIEINHGWQFAGAAESLAEAVKKPAQPVDLPHTWNAEDSLTGSGYFRGKCWYFKKLEWKELPREKEIWVEFLGVGQSAEVYLNGEFLTAHLGGYTTFRANLTAHLKQGENLLAVAADNAPCTNLYPQDADFTFYGGIYREVRLIEVPKAHFSLGYYGSLGLKLTPQVVGKNAVVTAEVWTEGPAKSVHINIGDVRGEAPLENGYASINLTIETVHLWDGLTDPFQYTAHAALDSGDELDVKFGCRSINFDPEKGFFLNGRSYPLRGVCRHQDRLGYGNALTHAMHKEDLEIIRDVGANTIRLAHYPHHPYFYDLCDENGMVVWAEIPYISRHLPNARESTLTQMRELIVQNYNRPSIVCWGLSNEISMISILTDELNEDHHLLNDLCHELDKTRPTTMAHVNSLEMDSELQEIPDIGSYNLYFGWYLGKFPDNGRFLDAYHEMHPDRCIGLSEYGADANPELQSPEPRRGDFTESYQSIYHENLLKIIDERPYLWATHLWNMFDFCSTTRNDGGKHARNQKGLVTMDRKTYKDAFYLYKAHWSKEPVLHLCGRRYADRTEQETEIKVYSNCEEVSLFVNGKLWSSQKGAYIFRFRIPCTGELEIEAVSKTLKDSMRIRKVDAPNPKYSLERKPNVVDWVKQDALSEDFCSIHDTLRSLLKNPEAHGKTTELLLKMDPDFFADQCTAKMMCDHPMEDILNMHFSVLDQETVNQYNDFLQGIPKVY